MSADRQPKRPNILFIMTDQESVSLSRCYGNGLVRTPARDQIAHGGMRFNNHYVASFPCSPSRATMITGLYAHHHGVVTNGIVLEQETRTLGSHFQQAGYHTTWIGKSHLGGWFEPHDEPTCPYHERLETDMGYQWTKHPGGAGGEDYALHGFDTWVSGWTDYRNYLRTTDLPDEIKYDRWVGGHAVMPSAPDSEHAYSRLTAEHHMAHWIADEGVKAIEQAADADDPFCLVVSFYAPHHPVAPPKPYDTMYSPEDVELPASYRASTDGKNLPGVNPENNHDNCIAGHWTEQQARGYLARYMGYVTYLDDQIARVLAALERQGMADDTLIVFTSDHGDMLCEQGMIYKHTFNGYDTLMKVPLMVQWTGGGIAPGQVHDGLTSHVDLVPTLLELAGVEPTAPMDGSSMAGVLTGDAATARQEVFVDVMNEGLVLRRGRWKFVLNAALTGGTMVRKLDELYDMQDDPHEMVNLAADPQHADRRADMTQRLFDWLEATGHPYADKLRQVAGLPVGTE